MFIRNGTRILLAVVALGLLVGPSACEPKAAETVATDEAEAATPVLVSEVVTGDITVKLSYVADLKPSSEIRVYSQVMDRILEFPWNNGDEIEAGAMVAIIKSEGMDKGLDQAAAQIRALDVQLAKLKTDLRRSKDLLSRKVIAQQDYDQVETAYRATQAQRAAATAGKAQLQVMAGNALVTAPMAGVVASKILEVGDMAAPQFPLLRILSVDDLKAELRLVEADVGKVHMGQEVEIRLDAYPGERFLGQITRVMPYIDPVTRTNLVEVTVPNPKGEGGERKLKPGMYGRAELVLARREGVVVVPERALLIDDVLAELAGDGERLRRAFVVAEGEVARERTVKLGAREGSLFEVIEGLAVGDKLVTRGQHGLEDGEKVEIATAGAQ